MFSFDIQQHNTTLLPEQDPPSITIAIPPQDGTGVVPKTELLQEVAGRLAEVFRDLAARITITPTPNSAPTQVTAAVPIASHNAILRQLKVAIAIGSSASARVQRLISDLEQAQISQSGETVAYTRSLFTDLSEVLTELRVREASVNTATATILPLTAPILGQFATPTSAAFFQTQLARLDSTKGDTPPHTGITNTGLMNRVANVQQAANTVAAFNPSSVSGATLPVAPYTSLYLEYASPLIPVVPALNSIDPWWRAHEAGKLFLDPVSLFTPLRIMLPLTSENTTFLFPEPKLALDRGFLDQDIFVTVTLGDDGKLPDDVFTYKNTSYINLLGATLGKDAVTGNTFHSALTGDKITDVKGMQDDLKTAFEVLCSSRFATEEERVRAWFLIMRGQAAIGNTLHAGYGIGNLPYAATDPFAFRITADDAKISPFAALSIYYLNWLPAMLTAGYAELTSLTVQASDIRAAVAAHAARIEDALALAFPGKETPTSRSIAAPFRTRRARR